MQLLRSVAIFTGLLSTAVVNALPTASPDSSPQFTTCKLSDAVLPTSNGTSMLSAPDPGLSLTRVVLGRGTQNYTCADSTNSTAPVPAGAVATLYDASCLAVNYPELLHQLPDVIIGLSQSYTSDFLIGLPGSVPEIGHHYFAPDFSTPVFDFRMSPGQDKIFTGTRKESLLAPKFAVKGGSTKEQFGAVNWLSLEALPDKSVGYKLVYRVYTAGGMAPGTCSGRPPAFEIQYATEYWFYN